MASQLDRGVVLALVKEALAAPAKASGVAASALDEKTVLLGHDGLLDSLGLVTVVVDIEQLLSERHRVNVTLADEKAMSLRSSPFRTIGTLADHVVRTAAGS
jgi:acyl carrier protein